MIVEQVTVRLCTPEDLAALHSREAHPEAHLAQRHFERQQAGNYYFALAVNDSTILGFCAVDCDRSLPLCPEIKSLWVYPEARRQGAGRALTRYLEETVRNLGFVEVFLRVDPENPAAIPLYIGLDYSPTGDHVLTNYESVDATGALHTTEEMDAVYRKSLLLR